MMRREKNWIVITCDACGLKRCDREWRPYRLSWLEAEGAGWKAIPISGGKDFARQCSDCVAVNAPINLDPQRRIV